MSLTFSRLHRRFNPSALDRRDYLKVTLAAAIGLVSTATGFGAPRGSARRVIIVGAGLAGLSCAHELRARGMKVTVLEARKRLGGRVLTFPDYVPDVKVEAGGEFVGANHPAWLAYAKKFGLGLREVTEDDAEFPVILGRTRLTAKESEALYKEMEQAYGTMAKDARGINADAPWLSPNAKTLDERTTAHWLRELAASKTCKQALAAEMQNNNGVALQRQSYLANLTQVKGGGLENYFTESEAFRCRGGSHALVAALASHVGEPNIRHETPVRSIRLLSDKVVVTTVAGEILEGDEVVLAVPPRAWRRIAISPSLPSALDPQMGTVAKFLVAAKTRFWRQAKLAPDALTDSMLGLVWDATDGQSVKHGACLTSFTGGPAAVLASRSGNSGTHDGLRHAMTEIYRDLPQQCLGSRFVDWPNDELAGGGYSFPAPGQVTTVGPLLVQAHGRLHLAGEHTCLKFVGYMEGALQSGLRVARSIAREAAHHHAA